METEILEKETIEIPREVLLQLLEELEQLKKEVKER